MALTALYIQHVRNIHQARLEPVMGLNVIEGANGSGKTSLLEAIFLLGRAKSFRAHSPRRVVTEGQDHLLVSGRVNAEGSSSAQLGLKKSPQHTEIRINGRDCRKVSELVARFPIQLIRPESHALLESGPSIRRSFLDWGLFHVKHDYLFAYKRMQRALKQRNSLLKSRSAVGLGSWNQELSEYGTMITSDRRRYASSLNDEFQAIVQQFLPDMSFRLDYQPGWDSTLSLLELLESAFDGDLHRGVTRQGPHRSDLVLKADGVLASERLSRGQLKLAVLSLNLAQAALFRRLSTQHSVLLIDDVAAELDRRHLERVLSLLSTLRSQVFITTTDRSVLDTGAGWSNEITFHVKHGEFERLDEH